MRHYTLLIVQLILYHIPNPVITFFHLAFLPGMVPSNPILRFLKIRTRPEIDREKYALKAIRGDFREFNNVSDPASWTFEAARKI